MRQSVSVVSLFLVLVSAGCAESHGAGDVDSGPRIESCGELDGAAPFVCVQAFDHVCGDGVMAPGCVGDGWQCPIGWTPEPYAACWCRGAAPIGCECREGGWICEIDAGHRADAATGCPADPSSAEGTPCASEGLSCGRCTDSCGWCNILVCNGGLWNRLEAFPPPEPCTSFDCGPELRCQAETQYCEHVLSDVGGVPDGFACRPLPAGCTSCDCTASPAACEQGPEGGMTITSGGG